MSLVLELWSLELERFYVTPCIIISPHRMH